MKQDHSRNKRGPYAIVKGARPEEYCLVEVAERDADGNVWPKPPVHTYGTIPHCQQRLDSYLRGDDLKLINEFAHWESTKP